MAVHSVIIAGFGDIDRTGYPDRLYVHWEHQGEGIATAVRNWLKRAVQGSIVTHASLAARPFFVKRGYGAGKEQLVE